MATSRLSNTVHINDSYKGNFSVNFQLESGKYSFYELTADLTSLSVILPVYKPSGNDFLKIENAGVNSFSLYDGTNFVKEVFPKNSISCSYINGLWDFDLNLIIDTTSSLNEYEFRFKGIFNDLYTTNLSAGVIDATGFIFTSDRIGIGNNPDGNWGVGRRGAIVGCNQADISGNTFTEMFAFIHINSNAYNQYSEFYATSEINVNTRLLLNNVTSVSGNSFSVDLSNTELSIKLIRNGNKMTLNPAIADSITAIAYEFKTVNNLLTPGAKIASFQNVTTEVMNIHDGGIDVTGGIVANNIYNKQTTIDSTATPTIIDSFAHATYRSAKYVVTFNGTEKQVVEFLLIHNGTNTYTTTYAEIFTGATQLFTISADINGANVEVKITSTQTGTVDITALRQV